jgi:hypothetical protein
VVRKRLVSEEWRIPFWVRELTGEVDDEEINDELGDLKCREVLLPPNLVASSRHEVIVVPVRAKRRKSALVSFASQKLQHSHQDVYGQVGDDGNPRDGGASVELSVAEGGGRGVVEDVEELEGLLLHDEEDGVGELPVCRTNPNQFLSVYGDGY